MNIVGWRLLLLHDTPCLPLISIHIMNYSKKHISIVQPLDDLPNWNYSMTSFLILHSLLHTSKQHFLVFRAYSTQSTLKMRLLFYILVSCTNNHETPSAYTLQSKISVWNVRSIFFTLLTNSDSAKFIRSLSILVHQRYDTIRYDTIRYDTIL